MVCRDAADLRYDVGNRVLELRCALSDLFFLVVNRSKGPTDRYRVVFRLCRSLCFPAVLG